MKTSSVSMAARYPALGDFWDGHDLSEYWSKTHPARAEVDLQSEEGLSAVEKESSALWRSFMKAKTKEFDAVAESRKWKEAVAKETEGMTPEETLAYFDRAAVRRRFQAALRETEQGSKGRGRKSKGR
jgi:hypothetical protein